VRSLKNNIKNHNHSNLKNHDLDKLSQVALYFISLPNSRTSRYYSTLPTTVKYTNPPIGWKETLRYFPENTVTSKKTRLWLNEAERLYKDIIGGLIKDNEVRL
jgi:hypothetical protein